MNEKIKLFASRVGSLGDHLWLDGRDPDEEAAVEKFAELIVRECADVCKAVGTKQVENADESYNEGRQMGAEVCHNLIKNHFGVE